MTMLRICLFLLISLAATNASAEQKKVLGPWDVHYIAFNSSILTPEVARQYQLRRSKYNGIINISVLDSSSQKAQSVSIMGHATNLLGVKKTLSFKEVTEGLAVYSIAELGFSNEETYRIHLTIRKGNESQTLKFNHKFYVD